MSVPVIIPLLNPNESDTLISSIHVVESQKISVGDLICTVETTKSTAEIRAEKEGYIARIRFFSGQTVQAGATFCYITPSPEEEIPRTDLHPEQKGKQEEDVLPKGLRITQPALKLARELQLQLEDLPRDILITESWVQRNSSANAAGQPSFLPPTLAFDPATIIIYGGGGHGKMVIDLLRAREGYQIAGILDDGRQPGEKVMGVPILGGGDMLVSLFEQGIRMTANAVGGIGNIAIRIKIFEKLAEVGLVCPVLIHPRAYIDPSAVLNAGVQVFAQAYVGGEVQAGYGCIINTGAIVSHDCVLGEYVNLSPGAILAGEVEVGSGTLIGMGATVNLGVRIGSGARVGNGATVKTDVPEGGVVRAGMVWPA